MGELIEFRQTARSTRARGVPQSATDAQILFFTGVRYERHVEEPEPRTPQKRGAKDGVKRRRKRATA